ncbi:MAG: alpha/beta hydrolase [Acidimicrobiales bacterium]
MNRRLASLVAVTAAFVVSACNPLFPPPGPAPLRYRDAVFTSVAKTGNVVYATPVSRRTGSPVALGLDVYEPEGDTAARRPVIVWVHGGSFTSGNKSSPEIVDQATTFAKKGYVNVSIDYRLSATGCAAVAPTFECIYAIIDAKHDAQAAVRWLRANAATYRIDPDRIAIDGSSAGAITALNVGYDATETDQSVNPGWPSDVRAAVSLSGARLLGQLDPSDAPSLLFHGTSDVVVPYAWAERTATDAKAAGLVSFLTSWPGNGHVPYVSHRDEIIDQTTNFLWWELDLEHAT